MLNKKLSTIAKNIRRYRKEKNLSQDRLSKEAEVAYNIESGENSNPTVDTLEWVAEALGVSIEKLFKE
jgi:transcriptional regulator with XRE-family HTH domain